MGAVSVDLHASERVLDNLFPLDTEAGVSKLLYAFTQVRESTYYGADFGAVDLILDLEEALNNIKMTDTQRRLIHLHYFIGYKQVEIVKILAKEGVTITQQGISDNLKTINRRIAKFHEEGLVIE